MLQPLSHKSASCMSATL